MNLSKGYIGTYTAGPAGRGKGIYAFRMDPVSGGIEDIRLAAEADNPSWICASPCGENLYAVHELDNGAVSAWRIMRDGSLEFINQKSSGGMWPCHLALCNGRQENALLLTANYGDGTAAAFSVEVSGAIGELRQFIRLDGNGPDRARQEGPHAHAAIFTADGSFVYVHDLGSDRVMIYRVDSTAEQPLQAVEIPWYKSAGGAGPRHGVFNAAGSCFYSVNELDSTVDVLRADPRTGKLENIQSITTLPASCSGTENLPAEIALNRDGTFLYASNRGHDSIAVYKVREAGKLDFIDAFPCGGKWPRHFVFDPSGNFIVTANQESHSITVLSVNTATGALTLAGTYPVPSPVCIVV